jgi:hypothetical protein
MSMITELFGEKVLSMHIDVVKNMIKHLPPTQKERRSYLLKDWAVATGNELTQDDYSDVEV